jgi:formamidopyrimidine-DNA glycosylase
LEDVYRSGKEMRFRFSNGVIRGLHLMLIGDIFLFNKKNENKFTIVEMHFTDGTGIALTDRTRNAYIKLNPTDKNGLDVFDKKFSIHYL